MLQIRIASIKDAKELLDIYNYYVLNTAITFEYEVPTLDQFKIRIQNTLDKYPYIVAIKNNEIIGYAYAGAFKGRAAYDWSVETTIYVKNDLHNQGVGKALYIKLEELLKKQGITNMYACIASPIIEDQYLTHNSVQYHTHLGYRLVGTFEKCAYKFNTWYNMVWMEKVIQEHQPNQPSIIYFKDLDI